jgi:hypothetical protein
MGRKGIMEEYRVDNVSTDDFEQYLNEAAAAGWTLAAVVAPGDISSRAYIFLRRAAQ